MNDSETHIFRINHPRAKEYLESVFNCKYPNWHRAIFLNGEAWYIRCRFEEILAQTDGYRLNSDVISRDDLIIGGGQLGINTFFWNGRQLRDLVSHNWAPAWKLEEDDE